MNILVTSDSEWADTNSLGNTLSNWFGNLSKEVKYASVYRRESLPDNNVCDRYYNITPISLLKNCLAPEKMGRNFQKSEISLKDKAKYVGNIENKIVGYLRNNPFLRRLVLKADSYLFSSGRWNNRNFKKFVLDFKPDVTFGFMSGRPQELQLTKAILEAAPNCKYVGFVSDDSLFRDNKNGQTQRCLASQFKLASKVYGASRLLCDKYGNVFRKEMTPLYKGCDFSLVQLDEKKRKRDRVEITYAGNLLYGRIATLQALAFAIKRHNDSSHKKINLNIYSQTVVTRAEEDSLNVQGASKFCGKRPYEEIKRILSSSDVVLHVESFAPEQAYVRYSFSTKIVDCLQSGSAMMVIGPRGYASVEEPRVMPGVIVIDDLVNLGAILTSLTPESVYEYARQTFEFAKVRFDMNEIHKQLYEDLKSIVIQEDM